ncbi:glycoside hydrolase family 18 protein [Mycena alexandri]|uniref:Glycoside hydrolase family 18 protein n=1 Tax=Mycena alexandri TaxID=1745969 RepID=A0AAD6S0K3_9AGAR|nr:glycoside hydrolase family 18 protein [Mycena alexandri]
MARFSFLASILSALLALPLVAAVPMSDAHVGERAKAVRPQAREVLSNARAIGVSTAAPQFVAYFDKFVSFDSLPDPSLLKGFTVFALAFVYPSSAVDNAGVWESMTAAQRATTKAAYNAAGISLIVSAFGSGETPTSQDPTTVANFIASYVLTYGLDGVDIDYEDFTAFESTGTAVGWLSTLTKVLRQQLPQGQYILTHAPVAPWFSPGLWPGNGYLGVHAAVGSLIDWYNVQFYNQGVTEYVTCAGLLTASSSTWPQSSVFQIAANGVPLNKLVIGKGATTADANNGFIDPGTLAGCVAQAKSQGWSAGVMEWQYPNGGSAWITEVRADSWPVGGGGVTTTSTTTKSTSTSSTSSTGTGGSCSGIAAWSSALAYPAGSQVTSGGILWTANQWNDDEIPGGSSGAWDKVGSCATAATAHPAGATAKANKTVDAKLTSAAAAPKATAP